MWRHKQRARQAINAAQFPSRNPVANGARRSRDCARHAVTEDGAAVQNYEFVEKTGAPTP